ncbi:MAG: hypothetical protein J6U54_21695 [Clostridiales bacterium]|nr:hypothetical protein [Clostridiales bacterium]
MSFSMMFFIFATPMIVNLGNTVDLSDPDVNFRDIHNNTHIKGEIPALWGQCCYYEDDSGKTYYYAVPKIEKDSDGTVYISDFIALGVTKPEDVKKCDKLAEATLRYARGYSDKIEAEPFYIDGYAQNMGYDMQRFTRDYLSDCKFNPNSLVTTYIVNNSSSPFAFFIMGVIFILVGGAMILGGFFIGKDKSKKNISTTGKWDV